MAKLTAQDRKNLPKKDFAIPKKAPGPASYPVEDKTHAQNAMSRVSQNGTPEEQARVKAKVKSEFPTMGQDDDEKDQNLKRRKNVKAQIGQVFSNE